MAYPAIVIPVMIASPSDVEEERKIISARIHDWNSLNSEQKHVVLMPYSWETHIAPEQGARPQEIINKRVLKNCNLLIGVFGTRLGTPTGNAPSGTVEEIQEHINANKPAMIYFSSKLIDPEKLDNEQYKALKEFKETCKTKGIIYEYKTVDDFKDALFNHLHRKIDTDEYILELRQKFEKDNNVNTSKSPEHSISISEVAQQLLLKAASGDKGYIIMRETVDGFYIKAGREQFDVKRGRESAKYEEAINDLLKHEYISPQDSKGTTFKLTDKGWRVEIN